MYLRHIKQYHCPYIEKCLEHLWDWNLHNCTFKMSISSGGSSLPSIAWTNPDHKRSTPKIEFCEVFSSTLALQLEAKHTNFNFQRCLSLDNLQPNKPIHLYSYQRRLEHRQVILRDEWIHLSNSLWNPFAKFYLMYSQRILSFDGARL